MKQLRILPTVDAKALKASGVFGFSPSQVDTFRLCQRKWGFSAIDRISTPSGAAAALGSEVHSLWEAYLEHGTMPPKSSAGKIAEATLKFLPLPGVAKVEGENFVLVEDELGRMVMTCRIDFTIDDQGAFTLAQLGELPPGWSIVEFPIEGVPLIGDHKTTSAFDYAKAAEDLVGTGTRDQPGDAQATCYGLVAKLKSPIGAANGIDLFWSYSKTKGAKGALPIRARLTLTELERSLSFLWQDVDEMRRLKTTHGRANELPPNPNACDAFGGCPHRSRCAITDEEKIQAMTSATGSLAAMLGISAAPAAAAPLALVPTPAPMSIPVAAPAAAPSGLAGMLGLAPAAAPAPAIVIPVAPPPAPVVVAPVAPAAPAVDLAGAARQFFTTGVQPDEAQCGVHYAGVVAEFNKLCAAVQPLPPDAPAPGVLVLPQAPAAAPIAPPAAPAAAITEAGETETAAKSKRRSSAVDKKDPIQLLNLALDAARDSEPPRYGLVSKIAAVLAGEQ